MKTKTPLVFKIVRIIIFILLPLLACSIMFVRMSVALRSYMEIQVADNAAYMAAIVSERLTAQLENLEQVADYFCDGRIDEAEMPAAVETLLEDKRRISCGIIRLDGTTVCGEALIQSDYPAVRKAFTGKSTVRYRVGEDFLFTTPIYNGINIKYVLYEFIEKNALFEGFEDYCYSGEGELILADSSQQIAIPLKDGSDVSTYLDDSVRDLFFKLSVKMGSDNSAGIFHESSDGRYFWFASDVGLDNLYVVGRASYDAVVGNITSPMYMSLLVFVMLLALLTIGTINVMSANAKARESDELREAKQAAEVASKSKSTFLANMSHELRTPINVILGMNEMILREESDKDTRERAMDIKSAAQILLSLINDVLDFSKIESGKMNIICTEYSLVDMIRDLILLTENRAQQKSLNFEMEIAPDLPVGLYGDDIHIRQVLTNLLTNAVKYTPVGTVTLRISGKKDGEENIILHFEVEDTGIGIKEENIGKLMIPYIRVDEERNRNVEGTGLGMPIIVNLLQLMGGKLSISSVYGKGSKFWFDLKQKVVDSEPIGDIHKRMSDMMRDYEYKVSFAAPDAKILMVDDNSMNRKLFVSLLKKTMVSVTTVSSGAKCLEIVKHEHFDIIFMDYLMPEMDGVETLHRLCKLPDNKCKNTPVIALTANAFNGDREKYMQMGFDDFLSKPIITEKLEALIRRLLPKDYVKFVPEDIAKAAKETANENADLPAIEGVNWDFAKLHIKDSELLMSTLLDYYKNLSTELKNIPELAAKTDTEDGLSSYRIRVHALKSTSAMVGILSVSEIAKLLEFAAKDGERDKIKTLNPILLEEMKKTRERLEPVMADMNGDDDKERLTDMEQLSELLSSLREKMELMDFDGAEKVMSRIHEYSYGEELNEYIDQLESDVSVLDFDSALELLPKIVELVDSVNQT